MSLDVATNTEPHLTLDTLVEGRHLVRGFVSYAHADQNEVDDLQRLLMPHLRASRKYAFDLWKDEAITPGERWRQQIEDALQNAHIGLLLLSPEFFDSNFIVQEELPVFFDGRGRVVPGKRLVPVELKRIGFDYMNLRGLDALQLFRDRDGKAFVERSGHHRDAWVAALARAIHVMLDRYGRVEG